MPGYLMEINDGLESGKKQRGKSVSSSNSCDEPPIDAAWQQLVRAIPIIPDEEKADPRVQSGEGHRPRQITIELGIDYRLRHARAAGYDFSFSDQIPSHLDAYRHETNPTTFLREHRSVEISDYKSLHSVRASAPF